MGKLQELYDQRMSLVKQARDLLETVKKDNRDFSSEENKKYEGIMADVDKFTMAIRMEERENILAGIDINYQAPDGEEGKRRLAFSNYLAGKDYVEMDLQVSPSAQGGYLAPETFYKSVIKGVDSMTFIRSISTVHQLKESQSLGVPTMTADVSDADWTAEVPGTEITADTSLAFGKKELKPNPLTKLVKVSKKLMSASAIPVEQLISERLSYKFAVALEKGFMTGNGTAPQPLGVFTASANGIPTGRDVSDGNTATAITFDGLINAQKSIKAGYKKVWIFHRDAVKMLRKIKNDINGLYVWQPSVIVGEPDTILGERYYESEFAPNTFTTGLYVGIIGDFRYYWIAELAALGVQRLNELFSLKNQIGFLGYMEADGQPVLAEAFARVKLA